MKRSMTIADFRATGGGSTRLIKGQRVQFQGREWTIILLTDVRIVLED